MAALVAGGLLVAKVLGRAPSPRTFKFVLGHRAAEITALDVQYVRDGEVERATELRFEAGRAPRTVRHEVELADGEVTVDVAWTTPRGRAESSSRVTLTSGSRELDVPLPERDPEATP